jgi:uncharacterized protein YbjT (DUF2867 family)
MILVTGAAGKTGLAIIQALAARGAAVRALVHRPEQIPLVEGSGAQEAVSGDMRLQVTLNAAARGVRAVYHICPNVSPHEVVIGQMAIAAARSASVKCFVYHSVLHPQTEAMPHHWQKLRVEERLFESRLPFVILQPTAYMQNVLAHLDQILSQGIYPVLYGVETRLSLVDLKDVAEAAAIVLTEPGHAGATYELVGSEVLTQTEVAATLSGGLGLPVVAKSVPIETWQHQARASGLGDYQVETLVKMFRFYQHYGFCGNPSVLGWLLRRPPTTFAAFVERIARERLGNDGSV